MFEIHCFNVNVATKYGINCAVLLQHILHWIKKNEANKVNEFDGSIWTYNSKKAFAELFPYMNERQIDYALKKLIDDGIIITGNYNKSTYDRTLWYAITKKGYSILQNCEMENTKLQNRNNNIVEPIPDINTNINTNKKYKYGKYQNVLLTNEELEKLKDRFPDWESKIEELDEGIELKGYKYKNHYLAILKWAKNNKTTAKAERDYKEFWE